MKSLNSSSACFRQNQGRIDTVSLRISITTSILRPDLRPHCLLAAQRDKDLIGKLRVPRKLSVLASRTKRFQTLINFGHVEFAYFTLFIAFRTVNLYFCVQVLDY